MVELCLVGKVSDKYGWKKASSVSATQKFVGQKCKIPIRASLKSSTKAHKVN
jgi:hypothetical protein